MEALKLCQDLLREMEWDWSHPRVADWIARAGVKLTGQPYGPRSAIPEHVYVSLAQFLDLRLKCQRLLNLLNWSWDHPKVRCVELKYRCIAQMPLTGYRELYALLDNEWFDNAGGF